MNTKLIFTIEVEEDYQTSSELLSGIMELEGLKIKDIFNPEQIIIITSVSKLNGIKQDIYCNNQKLKPILINAIMVSRL